MCWEHRTSHLLPCSSVVFCGVSRPACGPVGRGVQYGPVGMSAGQTELGVTFPCPTMGAWRPRGGVLTTSSAGFLHTNEGHLCIIPSGREYGVLGALGLYLPWASKPSSKYIR